MRARVGRIGALAAVCLGTVFIAGTSAAYAKVPCASISGAGSSLQAVAQQEVWIKGGEAFGETGNKWMNSECEADPTIEYFATSSGKGENQWGADNAVLKEEAGVSPFPAYIGTDVGPEGTETTGQIGNMDTAGKSSGGTKNGVVTVPVAQSAIAVIVSLPSTCATLGATPKVKSLKLEEEWAKHEITLENLVTGAGVTCKTVPALYARESPSGTTAGFKRWLDDIEPTVWNTFTETAVKSESPSEWSIAPTETGFKTGLQLAEGVIGKPGANGAIGYADVADAIKAGFTTQVAEHEGEGSKKYDVFMMQVQRNAKGAAEAKYASPEATGGASNCETAEYSAPAGEVGVNVDWSGARQNNVESTTTYPICTLTFDVLWHRYSFPTKVGAVYSKEAFNTVSNYFKYIVTEGQNEELKKHHYGKLDKPELEEAEKGIKSATNIEF